MSRWIFHLFIFFVFVYQHVTVFTMRYVGLVHFFEGGGNQVFVCLLQITFTICYKSLCIVERLESGSLFLPSAILRM